MRLVGIQTHWETLDGRYMSYTEYLCRTAPLLHQIEATVESAGTPADAIIPDENIFVGMYRVVDAVATLWEADPLITVLINEEWVADESA